MTCPCPSCTADGPHHPDCAVHLADNEAMAVPPCDCGRRDGVPREPENAIVKACECSEPVRPPLTTRNH